MSVENPAVPLSAIFAESDLGEALTGGTQSASGARVSRRKALGLAAIWRGVNLIAGDLGRHPLRVYRYGTDPNTGRPIPNGGLTDAPEHPAARVMRKPNECMTPFSFRQTLQAHALLSGNGYAYILRDANAKPLELLPLDPDATWPVRAGGVLWYVSQTDDPLKGRRRKRGYVKIPAVDMLHVKGLGFDGLCGYPVMRVLRETIGTAIAERDYGSRYYRNGASPGIVLEVPVGMKPEAIRNLRESWDDLHRGFENSHRPAILRDGVKLVQWGATARDAQLLDSRQFSAREIANVLGIPPHKVGDPSRTAYNSLESENQGYHEDTLGRWFTVWEQECDSKLLTETEKETESHTFRFDSRPLAQIGLATRSAYYATALTNGWLNVDEVRAAENLNPLPGGLGQVYRSPVNLAPSSMPAPTDQEPADQPIEGNP